jgi:predicted DCC family thiol-disulfide oxidoreductase YuxK
MTRTTGRRGLGSSLCYDGLMHDWRPQQAPDLPDGLILFDGVCALCSGWVKFIIPRDPQSHYRFVAIQSDCGRALAQRFGIDPNMPQTNVVIEGGTAWFKGDSALHVLKDLPGWGWTRLFRILPRGIRNFIYDRVAKNRYALFGKYESCFMPTPELRKRFVTTADELK